MAYGLLLYKELTTPYGTQRIEIHKDGFSGSAVEIAGLHKDGITISKDSGSLTQPITTSVLTIRLSDCEEIDYSQFFTPNATLFKVIWKTKITSSWETRWTGFITPDSFSENLAYRDTLTLTARDNLGRLNDYNFDLAKGQMLSVRAILNAAMTKAGVAMSLTYTTTKVASSPATTLAVDGLVNTTLFQGMTWHAAVELLLTGLGMTLAWNDANAFEVRDISQAPASTQGAFFINKSGFRQIRPAWKNLTVEQSYGLRDNFYEGQFTKEQCGDQTTFTIPASSPWVYGGTLALLNPYKGAAYPSETIYIPIQGGDAMTNRMVYAFAIGQGSAPVKFSFRCNNTAWVWQYPADAYGYTGISDRSSMATSQRGSLYQITRYFIRFRCDVFCTVGGTTYVLRDKWEVYDASTIAQPYLYFVMPAVLDEYGKIVAVDQDNEVSIYLGQVPGDGMVSFVLYQPVLQTTEDGDPTDVALAILGSGYTTAYAKITDINMSVDDGIEGRAKLVTVNTDHNIQERLSVEIGQVPTGKGNQLLYLGGLFYDDTYYTPLSGFARAQNGTSYDLLELVAREHISYNNAAYDALSGSMMGPAAFSFDKGVSIDSQAYRIVSASLAILSNVFSMQLLQQEASFSTTAYTIDTIDEEGEYSRSGGGSYSPGGGGGGTADWFIEETFSDGGVTRSRLKLNPDYAGMYAEGWISAGGLSSGGSGSGDSLSTLPDVSLSNVGEGDILHYDAATGHWVNGPGFVSLTTSEINTIWNNA